MVGDDLQLVLCDDLEVVPLGEVGSEERDTLVQDGGEAVLDGLQESGVLLLLLASQGDLVEANYHVI